MNGLMQKIDIQNWHSYKWSSAKRRLDKFELPIYGILCNERNLFERKGFASTTWIPIYNCYALAKAFYKIILAN